MPWPSRPRLRQSPRPTFSIGQSRAELVEYRERLVRDPTAPILRRRESLPDFSPISARCLEWSPGLFCPRISSEGEDPNASLSLALPVPLTPELRVTAAEMDHMALYLRTFLRLLSSWVHREKARREWESSANSPLAPS